MFERLAKRLRSYAEKDGRGFPDWAMRYIPIVRWLGPRVNAAGCILEIGANAAGFAHFARVPVVVVDRDWRCLCEARAAQPVRCVMADASALPFKDGAVDLCICVDTFEHLPAAARRVAADEILRVTSDAGVAGVAFPGAASARAEAAIRDAYRRETGGTLHWLEEHATCGLPDPEETARLFEACDRGRRRIRRIPNANLVVWTWMWRILMCGWPGRGNAVFQALLRLFTPLLTRMHFGTCYRTMLWIEHR